MKLFRHSTRETACRTSLFLRYLCLAASLLLWVFLRPPSRTQDSCLKHNRLGMMRSIPRLLMRMSWSVSRARVLAAASKRTHLPSLPSAVTSQVLGIFSQLLRWGITRTQRMLPDQRLWFMQSPKHSSAFNRFFSKRTCTLYPCRLPALRPRGR